MFTIRRMPHHPPPIIREGPCDYLLGACFEAMRGTNHWYIKSQNMLLALPSFYLMRLVLSPPSVYDQLS